MSYDNAQAERGLLLIAHEASSSGIDVFAHVTGLGRLHVRDVIFSENEIATAIIRCWPDHDSPSEFWAISLAAVRGVEIQGDWRA